MAELGGATTQSGILYQNTIAAVYLGGLCQDGAAPPHEQIVEVRCEAPAHVDDVVLVFGDDHRRFIQAKEALKLTGSPWEELWQDFVHQFGDPSFRPTQDWLVLFLGELRQEWRGLAALAERASGSACFTEWQRRLTQEQKRLFTKIESVLSALGLNTEEQHSLLSRVRVRQETLEDLELRAYREMPPCSTQPATLFRLLRDRVGHHARLRKPFRRDELLASLRSEHNITFDAPRPFGAPDGNHPLSFVPEDRSRLRWFVSSRLRDDCLHAEREAAIAAIAETQLVVPWAWERDVPAGNYPYQESCLHFAAKSDGLVLILEDDVSAFCRREYDAAASAGKTCYIFIKEGTPLSHSARKFLEEQRQRGNNPVHFRNCDELKSLLGRSLTVECVRAFRHSQTVVLTAHPIEARLR